MKPQVLLALVFLFVTAALPGGTHRRAEWSTRVDCNEIARQCNAHCLHHADPFKCYDQCMRFHGC